MTPTRPATTVIFLRPGFEVFLVQRTQKAGFLPNAWVFPGGRVDVADALVADSRVRGGERAAATMGMSRDEAVPWLVAGVRETFEESGVWLGDGAMPAGARVAMCAGAKLVDWLGDATVDLDRLAPWAWWVTPDVEPKRFDTRFFVAVAPPGEAVHDAGETVASAWMTPAHAVAEAEAARLPMAPPTWWTLFELSRFATVDDVLAQVPRRPCRPIQPILSSTDEGFVLLLPGDPKHPEPAIEGLPTRVHYLQGRWWADGRGIPRP